MSEVTIYGKDGCPYTLAAREDFEARDKELAFDFLTGVFFVDFMDVYSDVIRTISGSGSGQGHD